MEILVGIDVSKDRLDVHIDGVKKDMSVNNSLAGVGKLLRRMQRSYGKDVVPKVICEATGGYQNTLVNYWYGQALPVCIASPDKVRHFAQAMGQLAKTDRLDARIICAYGKKCDVKFHTQDHKSPEQKTLRCYVHRRDQLIAMCNKEQERFKKATYKFDKECTKEHIAYLKDKIKKAEAQRKQLLKEHPELSHKVQLLQSIPGVGPVAATTLISEMPELGYSESKSITALAGLAPFNFDSGTHLGKRRIRGGRKRVRNVLYMAALVASHHNSDLKRFYQRLRSKGKLAKVALIAVARKLLNLANAIIARKTAYKESVMA